MCKVKNDSELDTNADHMSYSSRCPVDCRCVYRGATGGTTVERPGHPGADAWSQSVSTAVHQ